MNYCEGIFDKYLLYLYYAHEMKDKYLLKIKIDFILYLYIRDRKNEWYNQVGCNSLCEDNFKKS